MRVGTWLRHRPSRAVAAAIILVLVVCTAASAQFNRPYRRLPEGPGVPPRFPPAVFGDGAFSVCKIMYTSVWSEPQGVGWATDYPYAGYNLMVRLSELTKAPVSRDDNGDPNYWVVRLTDDSLFRCSFAMAADVGTMGLQSDEVARLREYLLKGGFLWVDDFWGTPAWEHWSSEIRRVLPEYPITDVPMDHPIRHTMFDLHQIPQVTNINWWRRTGGQTSERGSDSPRADFRMIADEHNRIMVLMTHNTDIADSWERETEDREFFLRFAPDGYAVGINVVLYTFTH
jgi:hypothetical protein